MKDEQIFIYMTHGVVQSVISDLFTFGFLAFCIYLSQGSTWWTFLTGIIFMIFMWAKIAMFNDKNRHKFKDKKSLIDWANKLPD